MPKKAAKKRAKKKVTRKKATTNKGGAPKGNQNAFRGKLWRDALERALARAADGPERTPDKGLDKVADQVVAAAMQGDREAWKEIGNRMDGRPAQSVELTGDEDKPVITRIERRIIRPQ